VFVNLTIPVDMAQFIPERLLRGHDLRDDDIWITAR
jgi:hypothetical protein